MNDFLTNDLEYKELPSKPQEKDPYHHNIWDYAYGHQLSDLPALKIVVQTFFLEKVWLKNTLPTNISDICPKFRSFYF